MKYICDSQSISQKKTTTILKTTKKTTPPTTRTTTKMSSFLSHPKKSGVLFFLRCSYVVRGCARRKKRSGVKNSWDSFSFFSKRRYFFSIINPQKYSLLLLFSLFWMNGPQTVSNGSRTRTRSSHASSHQPSSALWCDGRILLRRSSLRRDRDENTHEKSRIAIGNEEAQAAEARLHALEARLTRLPIVRYDRSIRYRVTRVPSPRRLIYTRCAFGICRRGRWSVARVYKLWKTAWILHILRRWPLTRALSQRRCHYYYQNYIHVFIYIKHRYR